MAPTCTTLVPLLSILLLIATSFTCTATDTISPGRPLVAGSKLVSSNGKFALGFFQRSSNKASSRNTAPRRYLGVWFNTVSKLTPAWVANRENPLPDGSSSELTFSGDGNLAIVNRANRSSVLWSSKANTTTNNTVAVLLNTGNLVLSDASNATVIFWESFDHTTDTFLPGAKMGWNKVTGWSRGLVSNKNVLDFAPGVYSGRPSYVAPDKGQWILVWNSSRTYWSSGEWTGNHFSNILEMQAGTLFIFDIVSNDHEKYFTYRLRNDTLITRYVLDVSGQAENMIWSTVSEDWIPFYTQPGDQCDVYAVCGPFTLCREGMLPFCSCMKGFSIKSPEDWELGDRIGGCTRNIPLHCHNNQNKNGLSDKFYAMDDVRLPDNASYIDVRSTDECAQACLSDCSCHAYSYHERCSVWNVELLNVAQKYNGSTSNGILYLRLAAEEFESPKHNRWTVIASVAAATLLILSLFAVGTMLIISRKGMHRSTMKQISNSGGIVAFRYKDLHHATKGFTERLGGGGFGAVFKGVLPDATVIAVKRLDGARQGEKEFRAEVRSIGMIQHINLVKLIGFCCEGSKRLLVYEYMPNRSLDAHLFRSDGTSLSWATRYKIALGVARGLAYLHEKCQQCIIHCDIKPQNILLDASLVPKIADFGMAKFVARDHSRALTTMRGTIGYLAPEWIAGVAISSKVDVYSFGMVLLDIIFGRKNLRGEYTSDMIYFPVQVVTQLTEGNVQCLVDQGIQDGINLEEVHRASRVACWCIQDDESSRPTMGQVVQILEGLLEVVKPPMPKSFKQFQDAEIVSTDRYVCS